MQIFLYFSGGRELVFQTGPEHPWLIKIYANSANYPYASIVGQEFFQTGLIPGETDFRIFRDYGNIPGKITISTLTIFNSLRSKILYRKSVHITGSHYRG